MCCYTTIKMENELLDATKAAVLAETNKLWLPGVNPKTVNYETSSWFDFKASRCPGKIISKRTSILCKKKCTEECGKNCKKKVLQALRELYRLL